MRPDDFALSNEQRSMLFMKALFGGPYIYHNLVVEASVSGDLPIPQLQRRIDNLMKAQDALIVGHVDPVRGVQRYADSTGESPLVLDEAREAQDYLHCGVLGELAESVAAFRLGKTTSDGMRQLYVVLDHIIAEGSCSEIIRKALSDEVPDPGSQQTPFADYCRSQGEPSGPQQARRAKELEHWRSALSGLAGLPMADPVDPERFCVRNAFRSESPEVYRRATELADLTATTPYSVVAAVTAVALGWLYGVEELAFFTPISTRRTKELQQLIGNFHFDRPIACRLAPGLEFRDLASAISSRLLNALRFSSLPIPALVEEVGDYANILAKPGVQYFQLHVNVSEYQRVAELDQASGPRSLQKKRTVFGPFDPPQPVECTTLHVTANPTSSRIQAFSGGSCVTEQKSVLVAEMVADLLGYQALAGGLRIEELFDYLDHRFPR